MGTHITAVDRPRSSRDAAPDAPVLAAVLDGEHGALAARTTMFSAEDVRWEILLNKIVAILTGLTALMVLFLTPVAGVELVVPLVVASAMTVIYFAISATLLRRGLGPGVRVMRWINVTVEASLGTLGLAIIDHVAGGVWAMTCSAILIYPIMIIAAGVRMSPVLCVYSTLVGIAGYAGVYVLLCRPDIDAELVARVPTLGPWAIGEHAFFLALAGGLATFAVVAARRFAVLRGTLAREKRRLEKELRRFVSSDVASAILRGEAALGRAERRQVTVLFCDLRDFTALCERQAPEQVVALLNRFYERACRIIEAKGGTVNKFLGDGLLALFGAPDEHPNHARSAAEAAHEILGAVKDLRAQGGIWRQLDAGVGLDSGDVVVGGVGAPDRLEYTAIGSVVNRAARLQSLTRESGHRIILSRACVVALGGRANVVSLGVANLKGFTHPEPVFAFRYES